MAHAIHELSSIKGDVEVFALKDKFPPDIKDIDWITTLSSEKDWAVVSQDRFRKGDAEKEVLRKSGLTVFILDKQ